LMPLLLRCIPSVFLRQTHFIPAIFVFFKLFETIKTCLSSDACTLAATI
jgi:hypothetical protein